LGFVSKTYEIFLNSSANATNNILLIELLKVAKIVGGNEINQFPILTLLTKE